MTNKGRLILIDGNNYFWAAFHAYERLSYKGNGVAGMYGMPQMLHALFKEFPYQELYIVYDGLRSKYRLDLNPGYKGDRKHKKLVDMDDWANQFKWTKRLLHTMGIKQICNGEADDMIYKLAIDGAMEGYTEIIIVSNDKDFHQMIAREKSEGGLTFSIKVYNHKKKLLLETANLQREFGYHPHQCIDYLVLCGDSSDNIDGYPGIGEKRAQDFLHRFGSIRKFLDDPKASHNLIHKPKLEEVYRVAGGQINLTSFYMQIGHDIEPKPVFKSEVKVDHDRYLEIGIRFGLRKMMSNGFLAAFQRHKTTID